ncbi:MAG: hypothetical protein ACOVN5_02005 [Aquidulcibacter sp.]
MAITFPVLRELKIEGYELFETANSSGLVHKFASGVHVIAGINGLGKTTLLNIIYRMLLGPKDMSKEDGGLASTQHILSDWRNKKYFRKRVRDEARGARAEAVISFGRRRIKVVRSLRTLEVESLCLDGVPEAQATQDRYEDLVCELSGAASYFDFFAILRFLVFFLEDRAELIWDRRSQFDMFRLLFYDRVASRTAAEEYDRAQTLDSNYRNERVPIGKARKELDEYDAAEQSGIAVEIRAERTALAAAQEQDQEHAEAIVAARQKAESVRLRREKTRLDLEEARLAYEEEQQLFYQHVFPGLEATAAHVFLSLATGGGCLVCGNRSAAAAERLKAYAERHQCPVCESEVAEQENVVSAAEFNEKRLERVGQQVEKLRASISALDLDVVREDSELRQLIEARGESLAQVNLHQIRLNDLQRQASAEVIDAVLADDEDQIAYKRRYVEEGEARLMRIAADRTTAEARYKAIKVSQERHLTERLGKVKQAFSRIAKHLLAETCLLHEASDVRRIGQEGEQFEFPILEVMMSSGVFTGSASAREDASEVSESQREFIDLAFRMALMEAAGAPESDAMLVLETPEASLDSLFVREAGALFRGFAAKGDALGNVFIASTNLNNEGMIPALFGVTAPPAREPVSSDDADALTRDEAPAAEDLPPALAAGARRGHLINLLSISAPNAALRQHREFYEKKLWDAVYEDVDEADRAALIADALPPNAAADDEADGGAT